MNGRSNFYVVLLPSCLFLAAWEQIRASQLQTLTPGQQNEYASQFGEPLTNHKLAVLLKCTVLLSNCLLLDTRERIRTSVTSNLGTNEANTGWLGL
jgi:hypothetical protein